MAIQVSDLISSSFRLIGAIGAGETLETTELNDAFISLNQMMVSWNNEGLSLFGRVRFLQTVSNATNAYVLPTRPVRVESASVYISGIDCPLEIVDSAGWEAIDEKQMRAIHIKKLFCDYNYPTSTVLIWPTPAVTGTLEMWTYEVLPPFATVNDVISLPDGYEQALRYNFAVALLPEYPRSAADPSLPAQAQMYKASIVQLNAQNHMRSQTSSVTQAAVTDAAGTAAR